MTASLIAFNRAIQLAPFIKIFEQRGGNTDLVLKAAGIEQADLSDPAALITGNALYRALHEMAESLNDPYFAARAAEVFVREGPIQIRESFTKAHTLAEFLPLALLEIETQVSTIRYTVQVNSETTLIKSERAFVPMAPIAQVDAATASVWVTFLRMAMVEEFDASRVTVTAQEIIGIPPEILPRGSLFKRKWNGVQIGFPSEWLKNALVLDWKIPTTKRGEFYNTHPREAVMHWLEKICLDGIREKSFGMSDLAERLEMHPKSLQRVITRLGTSFQEIRDKVRKDRALEILKANNAVPNEEIAEMLGFSSATSFSRAFKRWTGVTPTEFRQKNQLSN